MFQSLRASQIVIRTGLALVFLWFGIHKFIDPQYWLDAWVPHAVVAAVERVHVGPRDFVNFIGIFEVLVAISLATGFFMRYFAAGAALFLLTTMAFHGFNEVLVRDIGLVGGLLAIVLWPSPRY